MGNALSCGGGARNLLNSAGNGDAETVREVLKTRPELIACTTYGNGQNVVHIAAGKGDRESLQAVVDAMQEGTVISAYSGTGSADMALKMQTMSAIQAGRSLKDALNARANNGQTPLMLACGNGHVSCVNFLLNNGAEPFMVDKTQRRSAIHYAAAAGQIGVLRALLSDSQLMHTEEGVMPLKNVRVHDMSGQCRYIDSRAENGVTALHLAAINGELPCVMLLLANGASMMVRTVDLDMFTPINVPSGSTPLHMAAQKGHVAIIQAMLQAHADALGNWAREDGQEGRRGWEQDGRIDLRSVANSLRQLPYHVAWQRGFRQAAQVLNPTIAIDAALESVRELDEGFGTHKLSVLAAYALRRNLLAWLETYKEKYEKALADKEKREATQSVIAQQRKKEALKLHSQESAEKSMYALQSSLVSPLDAGHTFSLQQAQQQQPPGQQQQGEAIGNNLGDIEENSDELLATQDLEARTMERAAALAANPADAEKAKVKPSSSMKRRMKPSRPAPPPPLPRAPSASDRALALASNERPMRQRSYRRGLSWGQDSTMGSEDGTPQQSPPASSAQPSWMCSPFASPFAAAADKPIRGREDEEILQNSGGETPPNGITGFTNHPSGVELADPPPGTEIYAAREPSVEAMATMTSRRSSTIPPVATRKSSVNLLSALQRSKSSKKSFTLKREPSARMDFQRAVSIPGFEANVDDEDDCGICLDEPVNVGIAGCSHKLCVDCATRLCQVSKKPPLCPFCRVFIESFLPAGEVVVPMPA